MKPATLLCVSTLSIALPAYWLTWDGPVRPEPPRAAQAKQEQTDAGNHVVAKTPSNTQADTLNLPASASRTERPDPTKQALRSEHEVADSPGDVSDANPLTLAQISQCNEAHALLLQRYSQRIDQVIAFDADQEANSKTRVLQSAYSFIAIQNSLAVDLYMQYAQSPTSLTLVADATSHLAP